MMKSTRIKSAALFMAIAGSGIWAAISIVPDSWSSPKVEPARVEHAYHAAPAIVVTYKDGFEGGAVDDGKGTTNYEEPYDASFFVAPLVDGKPERTTRGDSYYGWNVEVPATCAAKAKAAVGRRIDISIRGGNDDTIEIDPSAVKTAVCGK